MILVLMHFLVIFYPWWSVTSICCNNSEASRFGDPTYPPEKYLDEIKMENISVTLGRSLKSEVFFKENLVIWTSTFTDWMAFHH